MKKLLLFVAVIAISTGTFAQKSKEKSKEKKSSTIASMATANGGWLLGGSAGFSSETQKDVIGSGKTTNTDFSFSPDLAYFIMDRLAIGAMITVSSNTAKYSNGATTTNKSSYYNIGPMVRYYIHNFSDNDALFGQGSVGFGGYSSTPNSGTKTTQTDFAWQLALGNSIFLNQHTALEFAVYYNSTQWNLPSGQTGTKDKPMNTIGVSVGFQIHLNK